MAKDLFAAVGKAVASIREAAIEDEARMAAATQERDRATAIGKDSQRDDALARVVHEATEAHRCRGHRPFDKLTAQERALYERIGGAVAARVIREQVVPLLERVRELEAAK